MKVIRLNPFGVMIEGPWADLRPAAVSKILATEHLVIVRGFSAELSEQLEFTRKIFPNCPPRMHVDIISSDVAKGALGRQALPFHSEFAFEDTPPYFLSLYAVEVAANAAPTLWANTALAARNLPADLREALVGRYALQVFGLEQAIYEWRSGQLASWRQRRRCPVLDDDLSSGESFLTVSPLHSLAIEGVSKTESFELLESVFNHVYEDFVVSHFWQEGDWAIWNNVLVQHSRPVIPAVGSRTLRRLFWRH